MSNIESRYDFKGEKRNIFLNNIKKLFYTPEKPFGGFLHIKTTYNNILFYYVYNVFSYKIIKNDVLQPYSTSIKNPSKKITDLEYTYELVNDFSKLEVFQGKKLLQVINLIDKKNKKVIVLLKENNEKILIVLDECCKYNEVFLWQSDNKEFTEIETMEQITA
jgi:hypothetical protein